MRKLHYGVLSLGAVFIAAASDGHAMSADKFFQKTAPSVWRVATYDADGIAFAKGSAVVIGKETLLTNCHVLAKAKRFVIRKDNISFEAKLQYIDVQRDLCQITARNLAAPAVPLGDSDKLAVGQKVYTLGNPENLELTLSEGLISSLRQDETTSLKVIQTTAPISHGSSGGGLFDEEGRLIGITTSGIERGQNLNFAMPINYLQELPARSAAALAKRDAATPTAAKADAEAAKPALVLTRSAPPPSGYADVNDVQKIVQINPRAKAAYESFLAKAFPRAFALAEHGGWWISYGVKPKDPAASPDPAIRIVPDCEKHHQRRCYLYAVDNVVVWNAANVVELKLPARVASAQAAIPSAPPAESGATATPPASPAQPTPAQEHLFARPSPSGFASASDTNAIPFVGMKARDGFARYLTLKPPKAFAIGGEGNWNYIADDPRAMQTAIERCEARGATCWLYAVDNDVVWKEDVTSRVRTFQLSSR